MVHRESSSVMRHPEGGYAAMIVGAFWQTIEAAHNWSYVCELAHRAGVFTAIRQLAHPSPVAMIVLGAVWSIAARTLRRREVSTPQVIPVLDASGTIRAVLKSKDEVFLNLHNSDGSGLTIVKKSSRA
jgi:hypothetical protein